MTLVGATGGLDERSCRVMTHTGRVSVARQAKLCQWGAVVYIVAASIFFAFMPLLGLQAGGEKVWVSPFQVLGWQVFPPLLLPLALTVLPLVVRSHRIRVGWICVAVLTALCLFLALSSGLLFLPAPVLLALGTFLASRAPIEDVEATDDLWQVPDA